MRAHATLANLFPETFALVLAIVLEHSDFIVNTSLSSGNHKTKFTTIKNCAVTTTLY